MFYLEQTKPEEDTQHNEVPVTTTATATKKATKKATTIITPTAMPTKLTEKDLKEATIFWSEAENIKPAQPFQWFPIKDISNAYRDPGLKRTIFCATSGHTGTKLLTKILKTCKGVYSIHEPSKVELSIAGPYLWMTNEHPMNETFSNRSHKLKLIKDGFKKGNIYAETSNMFIKTFYDIVLSEKEFDVDIVILRRNLPKVFRSRKIYTKISILNIKNISQSFSLLRYDHSWLV